MERGRCKRCPNCVEYTVPPHARATILKCINCNCPPGAHEKLTVNQARENPPFGLDGMVLMSCSRCSVPGCGQQVEFDPNTGAEYPFCGSHMITGVLYTMNDPTLPVEDVQLNPQMQYQHGDQVCEFLEPSFFDAVFSKMLEY